MLTLLKCRRIAGRPQYFEMNQVNSKKLLNSKWTAVQPADREKHFLVTKVIQDVSGRPLTCILEAVHSRRELEIDWRELKKSAQWRIQLF